MSKKQHIIMDSSCYAEYIALHNSSYKVAFLCKLLTGLSFTPPATTPLLCDNDATRHLAEDHISHPNIKHICIKFYYIHKLVEDSTVSLTRMCSVDNTTDILTKPLAHKDFQHLRHYL